MSDAVSRLNAALEGRYAIEREIGEGGMATVYLADDLKHQRKVALKVLKPELAAVVGAERFLAEITTTANLTHPHILPLHDSGEADSFLFYVMPHIEGESLWERIDREKQLGVDDAVAITQKVAGALDYAHQNGVVHRDIKPGNILLSAQGEPLVADFGIALAVAQAGAGRITETGLSLGTPHYMSPEQATGDRDVDPRSDVYALGCVLYEMLSGQPPFSASSVQAVLVKILTMDAPSITSERRTVPPNVGAALAKSLEKLPADRFTSAAEFAAALADPSFTYEARARTTVAPPTPEPLAPVPQATGIDRRVFSAVTLVAATMTALAAWGWLKPPPSPVTSPVPLRTVLSDFEITGGGGQKLAISRDGSQIAVTTNFGGSGPYRLFVRRVDQLGFREIEGTQGGVVHPTFSPNGEWVAFSGRRTDGQVARVQLTGGPVLPIAVGNQPHWGVDEMIVYQGPDGLYLVSPTGGEPTPILDASAAEGGLVVGRQPHLLPDGKAVIFEAPGAAGNNGRLLMVELESGEVTDLAIEGVRPQYSASGHLLYGHSDQVLMAVPFDLDTHQVTGEQSTVLLDVTVRGSESAFVVSETGTAFYGIHGGGSDGGQRLLVVGLDGSEEIMPLAPRLFREPKWSPDGAWVAYRGSEPGRQLDEADIYLYNVDLRFAPTRLTIEGDDWGPVWSPDGTRVAFASDRDGVDGVGLFMKTLDDAPAEIIVSSSTVRASQWPFDDVLVFNDGGSTSDLWIVDPSSDSAVATLYADEEAQLRDIMVSPDRSLAAYVSTESGRFEVYVRAFPDPGQPRVVSQGGGAAPFWSPDGNTLYYWTLGSATLVKHVVAVQIDWGPPFTVMSRDTVITGAYRFDSSDLHPDGDRIIVSQEASVADGGAAPAQASEPSRHLIVVNWFEELLELLGN